ncbi:hypothetical protein H0H93_012710 [Arthromyces matolae]|nr:hypothetical protein H0H93_012710 [Arthromyces matolae]
MHKITHVLSVCKERIPADQPGSGTFHMRIPVEDVDYEDLLVYLPSACQFIDKALQNGGNVLVHCVQGLSRSAAVVAAYRGEPTSVVSYFISTPTSPPTPDGTARLSKELIPKANVEAVLLIKIWDGLMKINDVQECCEFGEQVELVTFRQSTINVYDKRHSYRVAPRPLVSDVFEQNRGSNGTIIFMGLSGMRDDAIINGGDGFD